MGCRASAVAPELVLLVRRCWLRCGAKGFRHDFPQHDHQSGEAIEKTVRVVPCSPWWLKTTAARAPNIKLPKMLKRLLVITNITKTGPGDLEVLQTEPL